LTVSTLEGESIEAFAVRVFEEWKLGQRDKDNGVLIIVAPEDRKMRIEVGYGLEAVLTDVAAARIIRNVMTPKFKDGDFEAGIEQGVQAIVAVLLGGEAPADAAGDESGEEMFQGPDLSWSERILLGAFIFGIIGLFTLIGLVTPGGMGWFLYLFLIPFWAMFPIAIIGTKGTLYVFGTYLAGYPTLKLLLGQQAWYRKAAQDLKTTGVASVGGFTMSSGGSSWSSGGGSSSGGGFSGGGGSSGGGGASGSW
jgi:uncharacterized protein